MTLDEYLAVAPEPLRRHIAPSAPLPMRTMAAKGLAPLAPADMLIVMCGLTLDQDEAIARSAAESVRSLPEKILGLALEQDLPAPTVMILAPALQGRAELLQRLVLRRTTPDEVIAAIAVDAPADVAEIIAGNQERCLRSEGIVRAIAKNPLILKSSLDRLFDFLVRSGVIYEEMAEFGESLARLSPAEMQEAAAKISLPAEVAEFLETEAPGATAASAEGSSVGDDPTGPDLSDLILEVNQPEEDEGGPAEGEAGGGSGRGRERGSGARRSAHTLLASLNVAQKVALALRGNREVRTLLVRDSNRVVATAAIRSPRLTEQEIIAAAQSRSVSDDVVRIIGNSKDLSRTYSVKVALVNNPKTPLPVAMRFLTLLRQNDLRSVAKSKNISAAVANQAKRMINAKSGGH